MTALAGLLPLALGLAEPSAAGAASNVQDRYQRWERRLRTKVSELHVVPGGAEKGTAGSVGIRFAIGPNGRPVDPVIIRSSRNPLLDKAATRLVRQLGWLGQVPSVSGKTRRVVLDLAYGDAGTRSSK